MSKRYENWHFKRAVSAIPPELRAFGVKLLGYVSEQKAATGLGHMCRTVRLSDGSVVKATIVGAVPIVEYRPASAESAPPATPAAPLFYVDSGWLRGSDFGPITDPGNSYLTLEAPAASATYAAAMELFSPILIDPVYGGDDAGDSFGLSRQYSTADERDADADAVNAKLKALRIIGRVTGLMRCLVKGRTGRRLGEDGVVVFDVDSDIFTVDLGADTLTLVAGYCGVITTQYGFRLLRWESGITCTPLKLPSVFSSAFDSFLSLPHGLLRTAVATYLLAYAEIDNEVNESVTTAPVGSPVANGWHFSLSRAEAICTEHTAAGVEVECRIRKADFEVSRDINGVESIAVSSSVHESTVYRKSGAPVVWIPTQPPPYEMARVRHSASASIQTQAGVYAFYNEDDEITPLYVQNVSDSGSPFTEVITDITTSCCGACTATYTYESATGVKIVSGVECHDYSDTSGFGARTKNEIDGTAVQSLGALEAGIALVYAGAICFQSGAFTFGDLCTQLYAGPHVYDAAAWSGTESDGDKAVTIPFLFVDGAFAVRLKSRQMDANVSHSEDTKGLSGGIASVSGVTVKWTKTYGTNASITGGGVANTHTTAPLSYLRDYSKLGTGYGVNPFGNQLCVSVSASNTDISDSSMPITWVDQFISDTGPLEFVSLMTHSWHGQGWMRLAPNELSVAFGGLDPPVNDGAYSECTLTPIGIE